MSAYTEIAGGYKYAALRAGLSLMNPQGKEVYFQPGDDTATIRDTIKSLDEVADDKRGQIADMCLGDYFA